MAARRSREWSGDALASFRWAREATWCDRKTGDRFQTLFAVRKSGEAAGAPAAAAQP